MNQVVCVQAEKPTGYYMAFFFLIWHLSCQNFFFFYKVALIFFYKFAEKWSMLKVGFYRQNDFNRDPCPRLNSSSKLWTSVLFPSIKEADASTMSSAKFRLNARLWGHTFAAFPRDVCVDLRRSLFAVFSDNNATKTTLMRTCYWLLWWIKRNLIRTNFKGICTACYAGVMQF